MIKKIRGFAMLAETQSFTEAARRLNRAQPWLSAQIRQLEADLGMKLFQRSAQSTQLTSDGAALLPAAVRVLQEYDAFLRLVREQRTEVRRRINIGTEPVYFGEKSRILREFIALHPDVDTQFISAYPNQLFESLLKREVDLIIAPLPAPSSAIETKIIQQCELKLIIPRSCPLADLSIIPLHALRGSRILARAENYHASRGAMLRAFFEEYDIIYVDAPDSDPHVRLELVGSQNLLSIWVETSNCAIPENIVVRSMQGAPLQHSLALMRLKGANNPMGDLFWEAARWTQGATSYSR